jgi:prepilin-type N-terminal cleavage/methylation domain-containing protein
VYFPILKILIGVEASHDVNAATRLGFRKSDTSGRLRGRGFTLLELLVVIVIIGLLAGLVAPRYFDQVSKSNTKIARAQIDSLEKALDQYRLDVGSYPNTDPGLSALNTRPQNLEKWLSHQTLGAQTISTRLRETTATTICRRWVLMDKPVVQAKRQT